MASRTSIWPLFSETITHSSESTLFHEKALNSSKSTWIKKGSSFRRVLCLLTGTQLCNRSGKTSQLSSNQVDGDSFKMMRMEKKRARKKIPNSKLIHNSKRQTMEVKVPQMPKSPTFRKMMTTVMMEMIMTVRTAKLKVGTPCTKKLLMMIRRPPKGDSKSSKKRVETAVEEDMDVHLREEEVEIIITIIIITDSNY